MLASSPTTAQTYTGDIAKPTRTTGLDHVLTIGGGGRTGQFLPTASRLLTKFEVYEWAIMQDFLHSVESDSIREDLLHAIHGAGAFREFSPQFTFSILLPNNLQGKLNLPCQSLRRSDAAESGNRLP
jgi:hypothetical protein